MAASLDIQNVHLHFGGVVALQDVSVRVNSGQIVGLIGPNGSGKTSLFNCITRIYQPQSGSIRYGDQNLLELKNHQIIDYGIGRTFQNLALFKNMSAIGNVLVGAYHRKSHSYFKDMLWPPEMRKDEKALIHEALAVMAYFNLNDYIMTPVHQLPFFAQKRVEIARALISRPKLLLLDEPANGLNHEEVIELAKQIYDLKLQFDLTILMVEHNMELVMKLSDHIVVLDSGNKIAEGNKDEIRQNKAVIEAYLGTS